MGMATGRTTTTKEELHIEIQSLRKQVAELEARHNRDSEEYHDMHKAYNALSLQVQVLREALLDVDACASRSDRLSRVIDEALSTTPSQDEWVRKENDDNA